MTNIAFAMLAFALFDAVRIAAFLVQMQSIVRDRHGAGGVSCISWALFSASHFSTAIYSSVVAHDLKLTMVFCINGTCSLIIIGLTLYKRRQFRLDQFNGVPGE